MWAGVVLIKSTGLATFRVLLVTQRRLCLVVYFLVVYFLGMGHFLGTFLFYHFFSLMSISLYSSMRQSRTAWAPLAAGQPKSCASSIISLRYSTFDF